MKRNDGEVVIIYDKPTDINIPFSELSEDVQITVKDTGWSEEEKERMKALGYDSLDMVRAWYS